jgi:hypothetical protein
VLTQGSDCKKWSSSCSADDATPAVKDPPPSLRATATASKAASRSTGTTTHAATSPVSLFCDCSGQVNSAGAGGNCAVNGVTHKKWCYVKSECPTSKKSTEKGLFWSHCTGKRVAGRRSWCPHVCFLLPSTHRRLASYA